MATKTITQLHRVCFVRIKSGEKKVVTLEPDDLGQDSQATFNIGPRKSTRSSSVGTTEKPIPGTFDALAGTVTILMGYWKALGEALGVWNEATYDGADTNAGNITGGTGTELCADDVPTMVVVQGICDDGSTGDFMFSRCYPSLDDDIEIGAGDTQEVTIALNPQIYNAATMSTDGYPQTTYRLGDASLTEKQRFNVLTGEYAKVTE